MQSLLPIRAMLALLALLLPVAIGCSTSEQPGTSPTAQQEADPHAGHAHGPVGPHGGQLIHLEPGGQHAEWTHDDETDEICVFLDDFEADKLSSVRFTVTVGESVDEFSLESTEEGWKVQSETLLTHVDMGEASNVQLIVTDDAGDHSAKIEPHEHHHH